MDHCYIHLYLIVKNVCITIKLDDKQLGIKNILRKKTFNT